MKIVIVGGGFGGVRAAAKLAKNKKNQVTLISDRDTFQYYPALYSTATGKSHNESWTPLGEIFADTNNVRVFIDEVTKINPEEKFVEGASKERYYYDKCIFAIGVVTTYYGIKGLETYAYGIKSEAEIRRLKHRLYMDIAENKELDSNYVIIGAGPTGVELAAALGSYIKRLCWYYGVKDSHVRIRLIEAAKRVLPRSSPRVSKRVLNRLLDLGVRVELGRRVEKANAEELIVAGRPIDTHTVIWTSGVENHPFFKKFPKLFVIAPNGKVAVDDYMRASDKSVYVIGDNAATPHSGLAQTAIRDANYVAKSIDKISKRKKVKPHKHILPVTAVPVGSGWAVVEWKFIRIYGRLGGIIRRVADFIGYHDMLPYGTAIGAWRASKVYENDYFTPSAMRAKKRR